MYAGGSGELRMTHVRLMVEPLSMYRSGAPMISVDGSAVNYIEKQISIIMKS